MAHADAYSDEFRTFRQAYAARLPERLLSIRQALEQIRRRDDASAALRSLYQLIHRLAGSSGMYGFRDVGERAHHLESLLRPMLEAEWTLSAEVDSQIEYLLRQLEEAVLSV